jgi:hypothetical protein
MTWGNLFPKPDATGYITCLSCYQTERMKNMTGIVRVAKLSAAFRFLDGISKKIQIMSGYDVHIIIMLKGVRINVARMVVASMSLLVRRICRGVIC